MNGVLMGKYFLILLLVFIGCNSCVIDSGNIKKTGEIFVDNNQTDQKKLTQAQMFADFDQFYGHVKKNNIRTIVKNILFNYDVLAQMEELQKQIPSIKSKKEFIILMKKAFMLQQVLHTAIYLYVIDDMGIPENEKKELKKLNQKYKNYGSKKFNKTFSFPMLYYDGKYILYQKITNGNTVIPAGSEITALNGIPIDDYIRTLNAEKNLHWDKKYKKFYLKDFYRSEGIFFQKQFSLTFDCKGKKLTSGFNIKQDIFKPYNQKMKSGPVFHFFEKEKILYIWIPAFNNPELYIENIPKYKNKGIKKVVLDIRGNPGGIPIYAFQILSLIIDEEMLFTQTFILNQKPLGFSAIFEYFWITEYDYVFFKDKTLIDQAYPLLGITNGVIVERYTKIIPSQTGLKYGGTIYILNDEESTSMSYNLVQMADQSEKLLSIGIPSAWDHGGLGPLEKTSYILTNSKIVYQYEDGFTITGVTDTNSMYHNDIEVYLPYTWEELVYRTTNVSQIHTLEYLLKYDPMMKYVISQK
jgi:hypothetical protein